MKRILVKILKIFGWIIGCIILLIVLIFILIQIPAVQNFAKNKIVAYLEDKIKTKVEIGKLDIAFPKRIVLKNIYLGDQNKDTLFAAKEIRVDIALFDLLKSEVNLNYLELNGIRANVYRIKPDTTFNFQYIVDAFAGEQKKQPKPADTTSTLKFHLDKIVFKDILTTFKDDETGNDVYFYLGNFQTNVKTFDPDHMVFDVPSIDISNINAKVYQYKPLIQSYNDTITTAASSPDTSASAPAVTLGSLNLKNISFNYKNDISAMLADLKIGELSSHPENLNLQKLLIQLNDLSLKNTTAKIVLGKTKQTEAVKKVVSDEAKKQTQNPWKFQVAKVDFSNNNLSFDDESKPKAESGVDFSHLHINSFVLNADSLTFTPDIYKGNLNQLSFHEQSGFTLKKFQTDFLYSNTAAFLNNLLLQTNEGTLLRDHIILTYPSAETLSKQPGEIYVDADLRQSTIAVQDIFSFLPTFKRNLKGNENAILKLNTTIKGYVKNLSIPTFELSGIGGTYVKLSGNIKGLPDTKNTYYDLKIDRISSTKSDLTKFLPPNTLPASVRLPDVFSLTGFFKGSMDAFNTNIALNTNKGNVMVTGNMTNNEAYNLDAVLSNIDAGYLLKQDTLLGKISMNAKIKGVGLDPKKANMQFDANVLSAVIKRYEYRDLTISGTANKGIIQANANISDENIALNVDANADINSTYPALNLDMLIDTLNLKALNFVTDTLSIHGHVLADIPVPNIDSLVGTININDLVVMNGSRRLSTDSIAIIADANGLQKDLTVNSDAIAVNLSGQYKLTEIATALQQTINRYYNLPSYTEQPFTPQDWQLNATILPKGLVTQLVPSLNGSDSIVIATSFNSTANNLQLSLKNNKLVFGNQQIDSLSVLAQTTADRLNLGVSLDKVHTPSINLYQTDFNGFVANNQLNFALNIRDQDDKSQYVLGGLLNQISNGIKFSLNPDSLVLDYTKWNVGDNNFIQYDSTGVLVNNFVISNNGQSLSINSTGQTTDSPIKVDFTNFRIATITKIANQDSLLLEGVINGSALVTNPTKNPVFTSDLKIDSVIYKRDTIGNIAIKVNNQTANALAADITIKGNNNDIALNGLYYTGEGRMDLKLNLNQVNLAIIKPFAVGQLNDIGGLLKGSMDIKGTIKQPNVNGNLNFDNAFVIPTLTGERFTLPNENIRIGNDGIHFDQFTLLDSLGKKAIITGDILTTDFTNYTFKVDLNADNFTVIDKPKTTNSLFYGNMNINAGIKMRGTMDAPVINANLRVNGNTNFSVVLPSSDPQVVSREGVVKFVDKSNPQDTIVMVSPLDTINANSDMRGIDVSANIETDSTAQFTLIIDERNGDAVNLRGRADLTGGIDKSGKTSLTGTYEILDGSYQLSLSFLKRKFLIQRGSTVTWTGDPTSANINITALYTANAPSIDLVEPQLAGRPQAEINTYKQKLPFQVNLKMEGELLQPVITFDITLPQDELSQWPEVDSKLQQVRQDESELNKQVFALLLLNRFVGENPLQSAAGSGGVEGAVRESASRILTDQLNQLASNLVSGVDINFDLNSQQDYSTGSAQNRTDLNVGVSKKLLNDRLKVNVGSNFELEGAQNSNRSATNIAGDVSIDYQLSKDGRYLIRAYRRNEYQGVIEGQVIETGVTFRLSLDYNHFREIFEGKKKLEKMQLEEKKNNDKKQ